MGGAFGQTPVARLAVSEDVFEDVKGVLHSRSHLRFGPLQSHGQVFEKALGHRTDFTALGGDVPFHV